jgi:hypothetical protein
MKRPLVLACAALLACALPAPPWTAQAQSSGPSAPAMSAEQAREENAYAVGLQAYLWGYPLRYYGTVIPKTLAVGGAYVNDFRRFTELKTARDRFVVTPNNVTIDAYANFDVTTEPLVVFVPKLAEPRWYIVQVGDGFDEIIHVVGGTKGEQPGVYVVTGPDFVGGLPGEMMQLPSRTRIGVLGVRILARNATDLPAAVEAQKGFQAMPLSAYLRSGLAYRRPAERPTIAAYESTAPKDIRAFDELGHWMGRMLPVSADTNDSLVASFRQIGLNVGRGLEWQGLDPATRRGLARAARAGEQIIDSRWASAGETTNGWKYTMAGGRAGHDLALRAALAKYELGALLSDQVIYPNTAVDDRGEALTGERRYVLRFEAGNLPPASLFWNLAMYGSDMLFVENEFGRYSIGSTTEGLRRDPDGSLTIAIQRDRPDDTSNWLPAPAGSFNLTMRFYGPQPPVLDGSYRLPAVRRVQ